MARHGQSIDGSQAIHEWPRSAYGPEHVSVADKDGRTTLHLAVSYGHEAVALLLELLGWGADVSAASESGRALLNFAARAGSSRWPGCFWMGAPTSRPPAKTGRHREVQRRATGMRRWLAWLLRDRGAIENSAYRPLWPDLLSLDLS